MRHHQIARLTWVLAGLFAAAAALFAATRPATEPQVEAQAAGAAAFEARCARCHVPGEFESWEARHPDPEERRAWLDRLLQRHHPPPETERPLVIDYIEGSLSGGV